MTTSVLKVSNDHPSGWRRRERTDYNDAIHLAPVQNRLLASISAETFNHVRPYLHRVPLRRRQILQECNRPLEYVHFIEHGVASLFARTPRDGPVAVAMIGRLGVVGISVVLGTMRSPNRCLVQVPGEALRIASQDLRQVIDICPELRQQLMNYVQALLVQNSQSVLCNIRHELSERLCRWLLLACDRLDDRRITVTHDILSMTLGVRRAGVTMALAKLEATGALHRSRGAIGVIDRGILERASCECYRIISREYSRLTAGTLLTTFEQPQGFERPQEFWLQHGATALDR
jgi:CRP-like cAMP-binding protein